MGKKEKLIEARKDSYIVDDSDNRENEYNYEHEHEHELQDKSIDQEYFIDTVDIIRQELEKFVEDNALSLCEYTDDINLSNFLTYVLYK